MADERRGRTPLGATLRALWPRSLWGRVLLVAIPVLLVLVAVSPFVAAASGLVDLFGRLLAPLVQTPTGRLLLFNALLLVAAVIAVLAMRDRIRELRSGLRLRSHLEGIAALVEGDTPRARDRLRRAARGRARPPRELPEIAAHARLGLARLALADGDADGCIRWLAEVRDADLPDELRRSLVQLRFLAVDLQGEALPEQLEADLRAALATFPDDLALLRRLRELLRTRGALDAAADVQRRIAEHAPPAEQRAERERHAADLVLAGAAALRAQPGAVDDALARAEAARRADPDAAGPHLLRGDALRAKQDLTGALRSYAQAADLEALRRAAALVDAAPDALTPRELLEAFPLDGGILLAARAFAHRGDERAAERAIRLAMRHLGPRPEVADAITSTLALTSTDPQRFLLPPSSDVLAPDLPPR